MTDIYVKNIQKLFACWQENMPFGQTDVMEWLGCSKSKATNIMNAMKAAHIIQSVRGNGPGKYKFVDER